ncbi:MAG: hypothetical protein Q7S02_03970 [bacterium]|nr:hypothetical protein [bacterium]
MTDDFLSYLALFVTLVLAIPGTIVVPVFVLGVAFRAASPYIQRWRRIIR